MEKINLHQKNGKFILLVTTLTSGVSFLLGSALTLAIPAFQVSFNASLATVQWIFTAYMLPLSALILLSGALGDKFGLKKIFFLGQLIFTIALLLSGIAQSAIMLIVFQGVLGIGAALMIPGSLAILKRCVHEKEQGQAIGLWAGLSGALAALGPFIGGFVVESFSWRYLFFTLFPLMALTCFLSYTYIPTFPKNKQTKLDLLGATLMSIGLFLFSFGLLTSSEKGFSDPLVYLTIPSGLLLLSMFVWYEKRIDNPLIPFSIFKKKRVLIANINTLAIYSGLSGMFFFLSILLQQFYGLSGTYAGLALLPATVTIALLSKFSGKYTDTHGEKTQMIVGPFILALGIGLLFFVDNTLSYWTIIFPSLLLFGLGMVIVIPAITRSALSVTSRFTGTASGINNAVARFAGLLAVSVFATVLSLIFQQSLSGNLSNTQLSAIEKQTVLSQKSAVLEISLPDSFSQEEKRNTQKTINTTFLSAFRLSLLIPFVFAFLAGILARIYFPKKND